MVDFYLVPQGTVNVIICKVLSTWAHMAGLHTNFFSCLPFGQVKSSLSDFYLPERKIYLPQHNNILK